MEVFVKKTTELTNIDKQDLLDCFVEVFMHERSMEEMCNQYFKTPMGYSIHAMCYDEGKLVASHTAFPSFYWIGNKRVKAYFAGDTMVKKGYRDGFVFLDLIRALGTYMKQEGYVFSFGFPNDKAYPIYKKIKLAKDIGRLDTYILPYRIGGIRKGLAWLNPLSILFCRICLLFCRIGLADSSFQPFIHKDETTYNDSRYQRMDGNYNHVKLESTEFYYKIKMHEGIRTAFLIDVIGKSEKRFFSAVRYLLNAEKQHFDLMMYVGYLPKEIRKIGLVKIPRKYEPKHFYMTGALANKSIVDEKLFFDISLWDVNLSNYDII